MKKLYIIFIIISCTTKLFGQDELSVSGGTTIPVGDFANTTSGGGAKTGFMVNAMFQHKIQENSKWWIAGLASYQSNGINLSAFSSVMPVDVSTTNWHAFSLLLGPVIKFDLSDKITFEPRIMAGFMVAQSPGISQSSGWVVLHSVTGSCTYANQLGANFTFKLSEKMGLILGVDYLNAHPRFRIPDPTSGYKEGVYQQISTFNLMAGFRFKLK